MEKSEQIYRCFSNKNKRRLLGILRYYPMTMQDLVDVTGISKAYIVQCLKEFTEVGIIEQENISHKFRIYLRHHLNTELKVDYRKIDKKKTARAARLGGRGDPP